METPLPVFKRRSLADSGHKKTWKSLKQILATEKTLQWPENAVTYSSVSAPPSFRPAKKYSDVSGLTASYTDPQTKLNYHNSEEFAILRMFPGDLVTGYLALRGANNIMG